MADGHDAAVVSKVIELVDRAEYKRRQAAPGPRVTSRGFGKDRRMPITNRYRHEEEPPPHDPRHRRRGGVVTTAELSGLLGASGHEDAFLTLHESAAGLGRLRYVEVGFFERVGRRAAHLEPSAVAIWAEGASLAAAWRAELLAELLPVSVGLPKSDELTCSAGAAVDLVLDRLGPPAREAGRDTGPVLVPTGHGRHGGAPAGPALVEHVATTFYPGLLAAYESRRAACSPAADGPVLRAMVRVIADLHAELDAALQVRRDIM